MRARKVEISESCQIFHKKGLTSPFLWLPKSPLSYFIFIMSTFNDIYSEISESELSDTLNTSAFNTHTHVTTGDLPDAETGGDLMEINGKSYILINYTANQRAGCKLSWI
jgi:hypothetical protein